MDACMDILTGYLPRRDWTVSDLSLVEKIIQSILSAQRNLDSEIPTLSAVYGAVGAVSVAFNACLLRFVLKMPYLSTSGFILATMMALDLLSAGSLLVEVYLLYNKKLPLLTVKDMWVRKISEYVSFFWSVTDVYLLLLVVVDQWTFHVLSRKYVFRRNEKTKFFCSLMVPVVLTALLTYQLPSTVDIVVENVKVEVFVCIRAWCHGSPMLTHRWRSTKDARMYCAMVSSFMCFTVPT